MSELISGKEALIALANDQRIQMREKDISKDWNDVHKSMMLSAFEGGFWEFRLKPRTITINGIEVPAPFEPEDGEQFWHLYPSMGRGYNFTVSVDSDHYQQFGAWRTEEEIKQVVAALRQVFGDKK